MGCQRWCNRLRTSGKQFEVLMTKDPIMLVEVFFIVKVVRNQFATLQNCCQRIQNHHHNSRENEKSQGYISRKVNNIMLWHGVNGWLQPLQLDSINFSCYILSLKFIMMHEIRSPWDYKYVYNLSIWYHITY